MNRGARATPGAYWLLLAAQQLARLADPGR